MADSPSAFGDTAALPGPSVATGAVLAGRYRIRAFLAVGGMGEVYRADDELLGETVAIKLIRPGLVQSDTARERFRREILAARRVTHPNVSRIFDLGTDGERLFFSMELLEGETLGRRLRGEGRMRPEAALPIVRQIAAGLDAAHAAGVIHRDFKADNVILCGERAVITDFGLARRPDDAPLTLDGFVAGTPDYMAPEQITGGLLTHAADLYALGVVLYELTTGSRPFAARSPLDRLNSLPRTPRQIVPDLDPRWERAILRCLERDPAHRWKSAAQIVEALERPAAPAPQKHRPFVGRQRELGELAASLDRALSGQTSFHFLVGEPGIGKTRLADELAQFAAAQHFSVLSGRAWEAGGAPAYWPWIQVLRGLLRAREASALLAQLGDGATEIAELIPETRSAASGAPSPSPSIDPTQARFRLFDSTCALLRSAAESGPLLVILDDLHAADRSSLLLLHFVAQSLRSSRIVVICTWRDVEARLSAQAADLLARVVREGTTWSLQRLHRDEVATLLRQEGSLALDDAKVDALHAMTEGNPLFVAESLHLLRSRGDLGASDGMRAAIREHLHGLTTEIRSPLELAAVFGREFAATLLADAAGVSLDLLMDQLAEAVKRGVLVEPSPARFSFSHGLLRETLYQDTPAARRRDLHLVAAQALERRHARDARIPLAEIAHHLFEARAPQAIEYARRGAEHAIAQMAYEEAAALVERALAGPVEGAGRCELLILLGDARIRAGESARGRDACAAAAAIARDLGSAELLALAALTQGSLFTFGYVDATLVALLEEALRKLPEEEGTTRALLMARLAGAMQPAPDPDVPIAVGRQAIAMARRLGDRKTLLSVINSAMSSMMDYVEGAERRPLNEEMVRLALEQEQPHLALRGYVRLVFGHLSEGDVAGATRALDAYEELARRFRHPHVRWPAELVRSMLALSQGRWDDHRRHLDEAKRVADMAEEWNARFCITNHQVGAQRARDDWQAMIDWPIPDTPQSALYRTITTAVGYARSGRLEAARSSLGQLPADCLQRTRDPLFAFWLAEAAWLTGDRPHAALALSFVSPRESGFCLMTGVGMILEGPIAWASMLCHATLENWREAEGTYRLALERVRQIAARPAEARVHADWAEILSRRGLPAEPVVAQARQLASELGLERLVARLELLDQSMSLVRDGDAWIVKGFGHTVRIKDGRGVQMLAQLVGDPGRELSALELGSPGGAVDAGDAGEEIDRRARDAYRQRLDGLRSELAEAESWNDNARAAGLRREAEALEAELSRAIGLGGRPRRAGQAAERARVNVQRRLTDAIRKIGEAQPRIGEHLSKTVRTGSVCSYLPSRDRPQSG